MKSLFALAFTLYCSFFLATAGVAQEEEGFVPLFNGENLEGWQSARSTGEGDWGPFSVNEEEGAIHVYASKEPNSKQETDCLNTTEQYSHCLLYTSDAADE